MNRHFPAPINEKQWANPEVLIERAEVGKEEAERQHQSNKKNSQENAKRRKIKMEKCKRKEFRGLPSFPNGNFVYMMCIVGN